jgi:hypothetical protein
LALVISRREKRGRSQLRPFHLDRRLYGHLFPSLDVDLAERLDDVLADALAARLRHVVAPEVVDIETARR